MLILILIRVEMKTIMAETAASQSPPPIARKTPATPLELSTSSSISQFPMRPAITGKKEAARPTGFSPTAGSSPWATAPIRSISMTALSPKHLLGPSAGTPRTLGSPRPVNEPQLGPTIAPSRHQSRHSVVDSRGSNRQVVLFWWQVYFSRHWPSFSGQGSRMHGRYRQNLNQPSLNHQPNPGCRF
jgi:hypothetical protein